MKLRHILCIIPFLCLPFLKGAEPLFYDDFPPITLTGQSKEMTESFKTSGATKDLYNKYYGFARMLKTGNAAAQKKIFQADLEKDTAYWRTEATRKIKLPPKPATKDDKAREAYEERVKKIKESFEKKKAVADAYNNWLSKDVPAWLAKMP